VNLIDSLNLSNDTDTFDFYDDNNSSLPDAGYRFATTDVGQIPYLLPDPSLTEEWTDSAFEIISANDLSLGAHSSHETLSTV